MTTSLEKNHQHQTVVEIFQGLAGISPIPAENNVLIIS